MKKLLLLALSVAAIVSCNRQVDVNDQPIEPGDVEVGQLIQLSSGSGATATMATTPGANQGVRTKFMVGDQIGLFAAYGKLDASNNVADWKAVAADDSVLQVGQYFPNWPAKCTDLRPETVPTDNPADTTDKFAWGATGLGGVGVDRIYPRAQRGVFVYAYYPYTANADTVTVDPVKGPQVKIRLLELNTITPGVDGAKADTAGIVDGEHLQADVLFAKGVSKAGLDSVKRGDPLAPLYFRHALAQLNFKVARDEGATECQLVKIVFTVPHSGVMNVIDGAVTINSSATEADSITYIITDKVTEAILGKDEATVVLENNPLMILPMTAAEAKTCNLKLTVHFGDGDSETDKANHRTFDVNLNFATMKGFVQGKKNTILMLTSETGVKLEATIAPWGDVEEEIEVPVE